MPTDASNEVNQTVIEEETTDTEKVVVRSSPRQFLNPLLLGLFVFSILLTGVVATIFGHKFGYGRGYQTAQETAGVAEFDGLTVDEVKSLQLQVEVIEAELNTVKQERDISLNNLIGLRQNLQDLEVTNLQLQQVNDVYGDIIAKQGGIPLQVVGAKIEPLPEHAFEYRFDVALLAKNGEPNRLTPTLTLLDETSLVNVPLDPKTYMIKGIARIRGRFVMPEGFEPKQVKLKLSGNGQRIERLYNWKRAKPVEQMPLSLAEVPEVDVRPVIEE